jgi:hypothetical protein
VVSPAATQARKFSVRSSRAAMVPSRFKAITMPQSGLGPLWHIGLGTLTVPTMKRPVSGSQMGAVSVPIRTGLATLAAPSWKAEMPPPRPTSGVSRVASAQIPVASASTPACTVRAVPSTEETAKMPVGVLSWPQLS